MIVDERIVTFINSLETENSEILEAVEQEALSTYAVSYTHLTLPTICSV